MEEKLLFSTFNDLKEIDLETGVERTLTSQSERVYSIAYDHKERYLYVPRYRRRDIVRTGNSIETSKPNFNVSLDEHIPIVCKTLLVKTFTRTQQILVVHKESKQESSGITTPKNKDGYFHSYTPTKAAILNNQFHLVYTHEDPNNMPDKRPRPYPTMRPIKISQNGVTKLIRGLRPFNRLP
ncbi:unnamed protein product [Mytilus coruscus]|uniref:Uncharacterized protein n=1 Tax=Mytilus coruscus TaxID=42192 RepID=A0A6J8C5L6_MYTCO|nr:unnamed protein product [Mytilus coruscus]